MTRQVVWIVNTGGTITSRFERSLDGFVSGAGATELLGRFPEVAQVAETPVLEFCNVNSPLLSIEQAFELRGALEKLLAGDDVAGAVVAHGTATMEETAYLLELTLRSDKPVVVTGAMLQLAQPDTDGPRNLLHAVMAAAHPAMVGMGVTVVMAGEIHHARDVQKSSAAAPGAMHSFRVGYLGTVTTEGVCLMRRPVRRRRFAADRLCPRVQLVKFGLGQDDLLVRACLEAHRSGRLDGLVVEGSGSGNVNLANFRAIREACQAGLPTVITSRCVEGTIPTRYAYEGSFRSLVDGGAIGATYLGGTKARILLMVALGQTRDWDELRRIFAEA